MAPFTIEYVLVLIGAFLLSLFLTPIVRFIAFRVGAVDNPNARRVNEVPMPSSGGLAIFISFLISALILMPRVLKEPIWTTSYFDYILPVVIGGLIITTIGFIDDIYELKPKTKMAGIILGAVVVWAFTDFRFDSFKIPFGGPLLEFNSVITFFLTVFWIISITNAMNLIDGLDGLVSGVSIISLVTMGALFIGFMIGVLSLQGLKNSTAVAVVTPVIILGVPILDTTVAIIRRKLSGRPATEADKMHLHHRLLAMGFTHRGAVLVVYGIAILFSLIALLLNVSSRLGGVLLMVGVAFALEVFIEGLEIWGVGRTPLFDTLKFIGNSDYRQATMLKWKNRKNNK